MTLEELWSSNIHSDFKKVKAKQLASHTSGLSDFDDKPKRARLINEKLKDLKGCEARRELTNILLNMRPSNEIDEFEYCNWGYTILGAIVEKLTNKTFNEIIDSQVTIPLSLDFEYKNTDREDIVVGSYNQWWDTSKGDQLISLKTDQYIIDPLTEPAGIIFSSIDSSAKYCQNILKILNDSQNNLLNKKEMLELINPVSYDYAFGWEIDEDGYLTHDCDWLHTSSEFLISTEDNKGIVICANTEEADFDEIIDKFRSIYLS